MFLRKILLIIAAATLLTGSAVAAAGPAAASTYNEYCGFGTNECLNNWGGGSPVKTYTPDTVNNAFQAYVDTYRCNKGHTSANCPISGVPSGLQIVQIHNTDPDSPFDGDCIGDNGNSSSDAKAADNLACDNGGANGGWGTVFVYFADSCPGDSIGFVNAHWASNWAAQAGLNSANDLTGSGSQVYLNAPAACFTPLGFG